jgi:hypothetical protein
MKTYSVDIIEADDGSGDAILQFPDELLSDMGWSEGTVLNLQIEKTETGNVLIITGEK